MATRLTQSGKTPISERISIFEQKQQTPTPSQSSTQITTSTSKTSKVVTTSRNFTAIKSQFNVTPNKSLTPNSFRSSSPVTPSPPSSMRSSVASLNLSNPNISREISDPKNFKETPTPAARSAVLIKQPLMKKRSESPTNNEQVTPLSRSRPPTATTPMTSVTTSSTKTPNNLKSPNPVSSNNLKSPNPVSSNNSFNYSYRTESESPEPRSSSSSDENDKENGNFPPTLPTSPPPNVENLNERNKKFDIRRNSKTEKSVENSSEADPVLISSSSDELDNVRTSTHNLNFKLGSTATTTTTSNNSVGLGSRQVRSTYWTHQALQNDNAQKINEVNLSQGLVEKKNYNLKKRELAKSGGYLFNLCSVFCLIKMGLLRASY